MLCHRFLPRLTLPALLCAGLLYAAAPARAAEVSVHGDRILVEGKPFAIRGADGQSRLNLLRQLGATVVRSYGDETPYVLGEAQKYGLKVIAGLWLEPPRRGFDYTDRRAVDQQLAKLMDIVEQFKDSPALLMWGIGNEVEGELPEDGEQATLAFKAIEETARLVRQRDPHHPVMAVLAETGKEKIIKLRRLAPSIQVLGVNSFGEALASLPDRVRAQGWTGPLIVTELGALGQWDARRTDWGAPVEPSSDEKAVLLSRYLTALMPRTQGQLVFYWGQKQEVTPTWHGQLLPDGEWLRSAEVMATAWGGATPNGNHAPRITSFKLTQGDSWTADKTGRAEIATEDPDGDPVGVVWTVMAESADVKKGGDAESVPPSFPQALREPGPRSVGIAGLKPGNYRLFVTVRDGKNAAATANLPFQVK
ncbi:MAG TPA: glycosyl hydrolase [Ferrovibrio sp.]|uniref:glycosyl hydrolase n=1 Tax=Ferrovibrio sp. TaxID=1917215 RepID=UPI002ED15646